ncbi:MAG TPA: hypothetical protein VHE34_05570 [Puia sp.]|jgi:hypothetical protein|uniref:hypothetical protein n=1 Tax=Puia sp. TaxID=2045100 RepID=UPI002B8A13BA|nr:hypothetical protein [Puia sp.]HVU94669.1 hypothetical protein [Puia sp.]
MITVSDLNGKEDNYTWWLNIMPDEMPRLSLLPKEVRMRLDYSPGSLDVLENYIRANYTMEEMKDRKNKFARDLFARYVGETLRRNQPELYWSFETEDDQSPFYGVPVLLTLGQEDHVPPMTPAIWVVTLIERVDGGFLRGQLKPAKKAA